MGLWVDRAAEVQMDRFAKRLKGEVFVDLMKDARLGDIKKGRQGWSSDGGKGCEELCSWRQLPRVSLQSPAQAPPRYQEHYK